MIIYSIYLITNNINGKQYVGFTSHHPKNRFQRHCQSANNGSKTVFHKAMRKYSSKKFSVQCLYQTLDKDHALTEMEEHFIKEYNTHFIHGTGYNMNYGGVGGDNSSSPNFKEYIANRNYYGENNPCYGLKHAYKPRWSRRGKLPLNFESWSTAAKGKSYYHNTMLQTEKRFLPSEIPQGWEKGRLKIACSCGKDVDISNLKKYHASCQKL